MTRFGFACLWDDPRSPTWSYIGWSLLRALQDELTIEDLGPDPGGAARYALKLSSARWTGEGRVSLWRSSALAHRYVSRVLDQRSREIRPEAVIEMTVLWDAPVPFFTYRDVSWDQLSHLADDGFDLTTLGHPGFTRRRLEVVRTRENALLERAEGAIVFSQWAARHLIDVVGLNAEKVHVAAPGASAELPARSVGEDGIRLTRRRTRLLFVGRDFGRKAGELTVQAFKRVRQQLPDCTLTIVGPDRWPLRGPIPDGVTFHGRIAVQDAGRLFLDHDLFVMPSWFEPYGIAFTEALNVGMPCIARNAFAMPEIVDHGRTGLLTDATEPSQLADAICTALLDDELFESTAAAAAQARDTYSWARAGSQIGGLLQRTVPAG
jgi:glycosyltransferase involved in cell wall biosynthesis